LQDSSQHSAQVVFKGSHINKHASIEVGTYGEHVEVDVLVDVEVELLVLVDVVVTVEVDVDDDVLVVVDVVVLVEVDVLVLR